MFQRIIVPLDGSRRAEHAIPVAANLARASHGSIVFIRVVVPTHEMGFYGTEPVIAEVPDMFETNLAQADQYLSSLESTYREYLRGIRIETEVEIGRVAPTIVSAARWERGDLIVMCSRGDTGLKRWVFRSIALQAVRHSRVPVLVLNEHNGMHPLEKLSKPLRVMVPLDGSALAETALIPTMQLLSALTPVGKASLHLLKVIDTPVLYGRMRGQEQLNLLIREQACREAKAYLGSVVRRLEEEDRSNRLTITSSSIMGSDIAGTILQQSEEERCDMIAMATHGRGALLHLLMGSVTERIIGHTELPMLITRPQEVVIEHPEFIGIEFPVWTEMEYQCDVLQ